MRSARGMSGRPAPLSRATVSSPVTPPPRRPPLPPAPQPVAEPPRFLEVADVPGMEEAETAVGEDQAHPSLPKPLSFGRHFPAAEDLREAHVVLGGSRRTSPANSQRWCGR